MDTLSTLQASLTRPGLLIGQLHRDELVHQKGDVEVSLLRAVKGALDPGSLLNPHKTLPALTPSIAAGLLDPILRCD